MGEDGLRRGLRGIGGIRSWAEVMVTPAAPPTTAWQDRIEVRGGPVGLLLRRLGPPGGAPVLLVPGLGATPAAFSLPAGGALADRLRAAGRCPWTADFSVSWRGKGQDLAALLHILEQGLAELRRQAGVDLEEVDAVGHSMGGILLLALAADGVPLRRIVTLGSGVDYRLGSSPLPRLLRLGPKRLAPQRLPALPGGLPLRGLARVGAGAFGRGLGLPVERDQFHPGSTDPATARAAVKAGTRDMPWALLLDLAALFSEEGVRVGRGPNPLRVRIGGIQQPVLMVAARQDRQCPLASVRAAVASLPRGRLLEVGGAGGPGEGYGHLDLLTGRNAPQQVFAPLCAFLQAPAEVLP